MIATYRPETLNEALALMKEKPLLPLAGGTDLMIRARNWQGASRNFKSDVILIAHLKELNFIEEEASHYWIGAGVTQSQMVSNEKLPMYLRHVVSQMATPAIRNAATLGGNIINAASVADTLPPLYASEAKVVLRNASSERKVPIDAFVLGKYQTDRKADELLIGVELPKLPVETFYYRKMGQRRASILSKVSLLVLTLGEGNVRIAIGALNDTVLRSKTIEAMIHKKASQAAIMEALYAMFESHDDKRSTKAYKEKVTANLISHWLEAYDGYTR